MSGRAITNVMRQGLSSEKEVAAFLEYDIKKQGCDCSGYVPVVAGGEVWVFKMILLTIGWY